MKFALFAFFATLLTFSVAALAQEADAPAEAGKDSGCEKKLERYVAGSAMYKVECEKVEIERGLREPDADDLIQKKDEEARRRAEDGEDASPFSQ